MLAAVVLAGLAWTGCGGGDAGKLPQVTIALDFMPNAAHAGVFAGAGVRAEGVALRVRAPSASTDSLKLLGSGRADVAIVDIHDLGLARERGQDLVGVAAIVQRPLAAVIARPPIRRPRDLEDRRTGVTGLPSDDAVLRAVVAGDRGEPDRVRRVTIGFSAVPTLIAGRVDAATAFWNVEGVALRERGVRTREFRVDRYGAPAYPELVLATKRRTLEHRRPLVEATVRTLERGTASALADPASPLQEIARRSGADPALVRAQFRAVRPALEPPIRLDRRALEAWARFDVRFGILKRAPDVDRAFDFSFVPRP